MIDMFIAHLSLKVVLSFANGQHMSDVVYWDLQVRPADLKDTLSKTQQVKS